MGKSPETAAGGTSESARGGPIAAMLRAARYGSGFGEGAREAGWGEGARRRRRSAWQPREGAAGRVHDVGPVRPGS
jgi:hypothetical protein